MIKNFIKRDGRIEPVDPDKINNWGIWMADQLGPNAQWSKVVTQAYNRASVDAQVTDGNIESKRFHSILIDECLRLKTWTGFMMAGKLYAAELPKLIFGTKKHPSIKEVHSLMVKEGMLRDMGYSDEEYSKLEQVIDHDVDLRTIHYSLDYIRKKYAIQNRITKKEYETPQFVLMRMAMALCEDEPKDTRLDLVSRFYNGFKDKLLSAPSPNYTNLGTKSTAYSSCCLYDLGDNITSLSAGHLIAHEMTAAGAGLGMNLRSRSINDPVRGGVVNHMGKFPYFKAQAIMATANKQGSRGGAVTGHFTVFDPEIDLLTYLRNPRTPVARRNRDMHFSWIDNKFIAEKVAKNEDIFLFNDFTAPDLMEKFYSSDNEGFKELYQKYENDDSFKKTYRNARQLVTNLEAEGFHTGTFYYVNSSEMNRHTPFKEAITSSNLCVSGDTILHTKDGDIVIGENVGEEVRVWNGEKWSKTKVEKTSESSELFLVELSQDRKLKCTAYHKWYVMIDGHEVEKRTHELEEGMELIPFRLGFSGEMFFLKVEKVSKLEEKEATYCVTEPLRHKAIFNGILTGQCQEIFQPKTPYEHWRYLDQAQDHGKGEISTCNLGAINVAMLDLDEKNDEIYEELAYLSLKMIDKTILLSEFPFKHLNYTSRQRMNAGVGIMGLATLMARNNVKYASREGLELIHKVAERHMYYLIKASIKISKERGLAPWIHKTKWPEGWIPLDTYKREVDSLGDFTYRFDWEALRQEIIDNGGIGHSCLMALMPGESSSKGLGATNSYYPIREPVINKTDGITTIRWAAYRSDEGDLDYESAWDLSMVDMIKATAVIQKFTDQGISMDLFRRLGKAERIPSSEVLDAYFAKHRYGIKSRYYSNSNTFTDNSEELSKTVKTNIYDGPTDNDFSDIDLGDLDIDCEGCSL